MNPIEKAAAKLAARLATMESVRPKFLSIFENTVNEMVKENPFKPTDCIVYELARVAARKMGVSEDSVKKEDLHNHWKSAEFTHTISTPMPPPPKKGMPQDPPVITTTVFKIHKRSVRSFSSSTTGPYLSLRVRANPSSEDGNIGEVVVFDPAKEELLNFTDKTIPKEIISAKGIGASKGWGFFSDPEDRCVLITDFLNPWACKSNPKLFTLPPLNPLLSCQTDVVWNVAMSSCPDDVQDWVVGIKSLGDQLSFCRSRRDLRWTKFQTPFDYFPTSNLMYSKKDQRFYLPGPGGHHLLSYDLDFNKADQPEFHELEFRNFPESFKYDSELRELFPSSCRTERFVESPSGDERFLVKWYAKGWLHSNRISYDTQRIMVFREEETTQGRFMCYTDDIGDLCIFVSKSEAFCVPASSFPGLKPNSIYFIGFGLGVYDLTTRTVSNFQAPKGALDHIMAPYWFPPSSS